MRKINKFIFIALIVGIIPFISSCSDDNEIDEWDMTYVSLLPVDYMRPAPTFTLDHIMEKGIEGSVEIQIIARAEKVSDQDIKVNIDATCGGISEDNINFTSKTAVIKAGSIDSEPITVSITNWDELLGTIDAADYILKVKMSDIETSASNITGSEVYQEINFKITKKAERERTIILLKTATDWMFTFMNGVENANANTVAGTTAGSQDVATDGVPFWLTVDFMGVKTVTGIQAQYYGAFYASTKVEVFISDNNVDWVSLGEFVTSGKTQTINFAERVDTRYMKYQMITVPNRVSLTRFYIYSFE